MNMNYTILDKETCYQGFFRLERYHLAHDTFAGSRLHVQRELLERGDAVAVLLYDRQQDRVLLLEQFRIGPAARAEQPWMLEIVAGMIDEHEDAETAARRECLEESGYAVRALQQLGRYYVSPGGTSERITLYLAEVDSQQQRAEGGGLVAEHEDIRYFWCTRQQAMNWLAEGRICSGAPMLALLLAFGHQGVVACG